ncbi:hypothetical protein [Corallococcus sp. CA047B]|uniref:hypothetical protein n=1 Tax=Corallococcus sp. CA047B TaxID=2316729 RepID=UPI0018F529E0|nr:hypothetical protein [Corallococcus sp. CA047B]
MLRAFKLSGSAVIKRAPDEAHLPAVAERLRAALEQRPGAHLVMTGRAQPLQALRSRLRADGVDAAQQVKAYGFAGKSGLD